MNSTPIGLIDEDYNLLVDRMDQGAEETCQNIDNWNTEIFEGFTDLVQTLCNVVKGIRVTFNKKMAQLQEAGPYDDRLNEVQTS